MANPQPERVLSVRAISVTIGEGRLTAFISVQPGPAAGEAELQKALEAAGVRAGIDEQAVARLSLALLDPAFGVSRQRIAQGRPVEQGEPERFDSPFLLGLAPGHLREDGTLDFHDRELLKPVAKGDGLGRVLPARPGIAGYLVDGTELVPTRAWQATLTLGPGAERAASGVVLALRSGVVLCKTPLSVDVVDQHVHEGPVDLHSGHLHMLGSLLVKGDVTGAFGVYASGDVEVRGSVDNGNVYAGGNLRIQYGVRGAGALVCAEGNLSARHAESATVYSGKLLQLGDAVHAKLAAERVEATGKLLGGQTRAELSVIAREAGSPHGAGTELAVAEPLELPLEAAQRQLERSKAVRGLRQGAGAPRGTAGERSKGAKLGRARAQLQAAETHRLADLSRRREALRAVAFVQVGVAHPGVTIRIGEQTLRIEQETRACRFSIDGQTRELRAHKLIS